MDLVDRLHEMADAPGHHSEDRALWREAANTITSLRAELEEAREENAGHREAIRLGSNLVAALEMGEARLRAERDTAWHHYQDEQCGSCSIRAELEEAREFIRETATRVRKRVCRTCRLPADACDVHGEPTQHATCARWAREARRLEMYLDAAMEEGEGGDG